jgi:hypothetical protein
LTVVEPQETVNRLLLDLPVDQMEEAATLRNADLREQFYGAKIARDETRKILLKLFPNLSFNVNARHDDDRFLVHNRWNEAGAQLSFNLLNLLSYPAQQRMADAGVALADQRRVATQMAVMAQVHVARLQYASAYQQFIRADAIYSVDNRISRIIGAGEQAQTQSKLDRVSSNTTTILSLLRRYQALALLHAAASKLQATMGTEPDVPGVRETSLKDLTGVAADFLRQTQGETAPAAPEAPAVPAAPAAPQSSVAPPAAVAANSQADVLRSLDQWAAAWAAKDLNAYLAFYAPDFVPVNGMGTDEWRRLRGERLSRPGGIKVTVGNPVVTMEGGQRATVRFVQDYESPAYRDKTVKELDWSRHSDRWLIREERVTRRAE